VFITIVVVPVAAALLELVQPPDKPIAPASVEPNVNDGAGFDVVAAIPVNCVMTGAVLSDINVSILEA
jgi:hypothetical protein